MAENISLDVNAVMQTLAGVREPARRAEIIDFLRLILNRDTFTPGDLGSLLQPIVDSLAGLNGKMDDVVARVEDILNRVVDIEANAGLSNAQEQEVLTRLEDTATSIEGLAT